MLELYFILFLVYIIYLLSIKTNGFSKINLLENKNLSWNFQHNEDINYLEFIEKNNYNKQDNLNIPRINILKDSNSYINLVYHPALFVIIPPML